VLPHWTLVGREVIDVEGRAIGKVTDTHPADGGGEPTLVLVHLGRKFPRRRWLPLEGCLPLGDARLLVRWAGDQIEDAPDAADNRWGSAPDVARAYWLLAR
jgi:uncharacterized protein YrrD